VTDALQSIAGKYAYGFVQANAAFTPTVGMQVEARVNGTLCAQTTRDVSSSSSLSAPDSKVSHVSQRHLGRSWVGAK